MNTKEAVKYEPGDWHVEAITTKDGVPMYRVLNGCGLGIGDFADWHEATLAASAPDLLAALRRAESEWGEISADNSKRSALYEIRAAILRATGGK